LWDDKQKAPRRGGSNRKVERGRRRKGREMLTTVNRWETKQSRGNKKEWRGSTRSCQNESVSHGACRIELMSSSSYSDGRVKVRM